MSQDSCQPKDLELFWLLLTKGSCKGIPLLTNLQSIKAEYANSSISDVVTDLADRVKHGATLSEAMAEHDDRFGLHVRLLIEGGERAGILDRVLVLILEHAWRCPECILSST